MTKKERKLIEEKISITIAETFKSNGVIVTDAMLKNVKKHSKAMAKKFIKTTVVASKIKKVVKSPIIKSKTAVKSKKPVTIQIKKAPLPQKK